MRIQFHDIDRPKKAAKYLLRVARDSKLSQVQEALARALGYRDWHELGGKSQHVSPEASTNLSIEGSVRFILDLADKLGMPYADVQYAVCKARLLRATSWSLDEQLTLRAAIWRRRHFGPPGRGKPGTIVKDVAYGENTPAYLRRAGRPTHLIFDTGPGERADFEVVTPRVPLPDFVPSRLWLPYGFWRLQDGTKVVFSRDYFPMWGISQERVERLAPWLWIKDIVDQTHFWKEARGGWADTSSRHLAIGDLVADRITGLPILVDIMPHLFEADVDTFRDGLRKLYRPNRPTFVVPAYAALNDRILG